MAGLGQLNQDTQVNNGGGGGGFTLLGEDDYELKIVESDVKANSKGTGSNLELKVEVASGPYKGTSFYSSITSIQHTSAQAQQIGQGQVRALYEAIGGERVMRKQFQDVVDSTEFEHKPFWAHVVQDTYTPKSGKYAGQERTVNRIGKFLWDGMPEDAEPAASAPPAQKREATPPPVAASKPKRPWEKAAA